MTPDIIKRIDRFAGRLLVSILRKNVRVQGGGVNSMLLIRPGGIGDALLLASALRCLFQVFPALKISVLAERRNVGAFSLIPCVHEVLCYDLPRDFYRALRGRYDVVIDTEQSYRLSAVVARLVRSQMKIGFGTNERREMFTHVIDYDLAVHEADSFVTLLKPLGVDCWRDADEVSLSLPPQFLSKARQLLQPLGSGPVVVIFPGASIPEKRWGVENFSLVVKRLAEDGYNLVVVGGSDDRADGAVIAGALGINLAGKTTLAETAAIIACSILAISGDSGVLHIAVGLNIPTVSLFGPSSVAKWAPRGEKHIVLNRQLSCSPCTRFGTTPPCPHGVRCMNEITADQVVEAAVTLLKKTSQNCNKTNPAVTPSPHISEITPRP